MEEHSSNFLSQFITEEVYVIENDKSQGTKNSEDIENENVISVDDSSKEEIAIVLDIDGSNNKGVIVLVNYENGIPLSDKNLLLKILNAVNLAKDDIALIDLGINSTSEHCKLIAELSFNKVIAFGTNCQSIFPDQLENYKITSFENREILRSAGLSEVAADTAKKKLLWSELKKAFQS